VSLTPRDGPDLKVPPSDNTATDESCSEAEPMNDDTASAASDVLATLCRMSLLRNESLTVSGGYARTPPHDA